jgi:hypothetical protein
LDEDDLRVDGGELFELGRAAARDLPAEHDQVDRSRVEAAGDVGEVVSRLGFVAEGAEAGDR